MFMTESVLKYLINLEESIVADIMISLNGLYLLVLLLESLLCRIAIRTSVFILLS